MGRCERQAVGQVLEVMSVGNVDARMPIESMPRGWGPPTTTLKTTELVVIFREELHTSCGDGRAKWSKRAIITSHCRGSHEGD
jgi:hypothetical protein